MSIDSEAKETEMFIDAYTKARKKFIELGKLTTIAPYQHIEMQSTFSMNRVGWVAYHQMLDEHACELANELNNFGYQCRQLSAWAQVLQEYEAEDQMALMSEFVEVIATSCVSYPHTLKGRFVFSVSHLTHQMRLITEPNWSEKKLSADDKIGKSIMEKIAEPIKEYTQFEKDLDELGSKDKDSDELDSKAYDSVTKEFRNKYHHRYPPRFEIGITQWVTRIAKGEKAAYMFGGVEPLKLRELIPLLLEQHEKAMQCFYSYSALARRQLAEIYSTATA